MTDAFPLAWPQGWPRTPKWRRQSGSFHITFAKARDHVVAEISRLRGRYVVVSSNIALRRDGLPYAGQAEPEDSGIAVYFEKDGKQMVFACDRYDKTWKNLRAIGKTIEAIRGIERWGASDMMERALSAFEALPPPGKHYRDILKLNGSKPTRETIDAQYRLLAQERHPDKGGSEEAMQELNAARAAAIKELGT